MRSTLLAALMLMAATTPALAQEKKSEFTFAFHGFISASAFYQDGSLGPAEGIYAMYANAANIKKSVVSGDIRQTRFALSATAPEIFGGTPKGLIEWDFLGGWGTGSFGDVSLNQRLRLAYVEQDWGRHRIIVGQQNDIIAGIIPASAGHMVNLVSSEAGTIGWRRPGIFGYHTLTDGGPVKLEASWEIGRASWNDSAGINSTVPGAPSTNGLGSSTCGSSGDKYGYCFGETSKLPAFEARLTASNKMFIAWVAGHFSQVLRTDAATTPSRNDRLDVVAGNAGGRVVAGPLTLAGTAYVGENLAGTLGVEILQFIPNGAGTVHSWGGWAQAGWNFTKQLSIWALAATSKENKSEARAAGLTRLENQGLSGMAQYREGPYQLGVEYVQFRTLYAGATSDKWSKGNQVMTTVNYYF